MIVVQDAKKRYRDFELDVSLEVPEGRVTGLIGKNGAGKSTTIKMILGLVKPDSGVVTLFGKDSTTLTGKDKASMGVALSEAGFSSYLCVDDVEKVLRKMYPGFDRDFFERKCRELGIPRKKLIREFSTGMRAKLRVLVAMSHKAKLLIMDEPTVGLDVEARNEILDMMRAYLAVILGYTQGGTFVLGYLPLLIMIPAVGLSPIISYLCSLRGMNKKELQEWR